MAIAQPVTRTIISTVDFGIPVAQFINAWTPTPWSAMVLQNGWTQYNGTGYPPCQYRKVGPWLQLRGMTTGGTVGGVACTLPVGYRPTYTYETLAYQYNGAISFCQLVVYNDGRVTLNAPGLIGTASMYQQIPMD